jgi:hypothetical protein
VALTRVQATGKVIGDSVTSIAITFATPPTIGNAIVVPAILWGSAAPTPTCADNRGNTYTLAVARIGGGSAHVAIFVCGRVAASSAPFTITLTATAGIYFVANAIEIGGLGIGALVVDQTASNTGGTTTPTTGTTAALSVNDILLVAAYSVTGSEASITVESVSPAWTQEVEELSFVHAVGESDSRILTAGLGTTASCSWTVPIATGYNAAIAAFRVDSTESRISQLPVEVLVLSDAPIHLRLSQLPIEILILSDAPVPVQLSQLPVEVLIDTTTIPLTAAQLSQLPIEVLVLENVTAAQLSQLPVEVLVAPPPSPAQATQLLAELVLAVPDSPLAATQVATEIVFANPNDARVTQIVYELIVVARPPPPPRVPCPSPFPVD